MACTWAAGMLPAISTGVRASNAPAMASDLAYDAFMALPDDARRANYEALVRDARSTQHKPMRRVNAQKRERLRTMKVLILDNSQREPSVASVWGHTLEDKRAIDGVVRGLGFKHVVAGALNDAAQFTDGALRDGAPIFDDDHVPVGLRKTAAYGLKNVVLEVDTCAAFWEDRAVSAFADGVVFWTRWLRGAAGRDALVIVNLRDLAKGMVRCPDRCVAMVAALSDLPRHVRPASLLFEEPFGEYLPCEVGGWTALLRATMDAHGWPSAFQEDGASIDGALLIHVHRQWGLADAVTLDALAAGCDGLMAAVCEEGAALGHACSAVALANLARLGNRDVVALRPPRRRRRARAVTRLTTGAPVAVRQVVYGPRAIEAVFGFTAVGGGVVDRTFDRDASGTAADAVFLADILGVAEKPVRLHTLATPAQFAARLAQCFGAHASFDDALGAAQAASWPCSRPATRPTGQRGAAGAAEACFDEAAADAGGAGGLPYGAFAERFVDAYLGARHNTFGADVGDKVRAVRRSFDLDGDRRITFDEYRVWLLWALRSTQDDIRSVDDLFAAVVRRGIMPGLMGGD
ncbi:hypothetical protein JL722_4632 [Aureococcus anophagefferens]|nr:hypothetical protein JL722_4632 [Aureococcus anophagefferens]